MKANYGDVAEVLAGHEAEAKRIVAESVKFAEASELPSSYQDLLQNTYVPSELVHKTDHSIGAGID